MREPGDPVCAVSWPGTAVSRCGHSCFHSCKQGRSLLTRTASNVNNASRTQRGKRACSPVVATKRRLPASPPRRSLHLPQHPHHRLPHPLRRGGVLADDEAAGDGDHRLELRGLPDDRALLRELALEEERDDLVEADDLLLLVRERRASFPATMYEPSESLTSTRAEGPWQTAATTPPAS